MPRIHSADSSAIDINNLSWHTDSLPDSLQSEICVTPIFMNMNKHDAALADVTPYQLFMWIRCPNDKPKLSCISACVRRDARIEVLGLRCTFVERFGVPTRYVGLQEEDGKGEGNHWTEDKVQNFEIDGPGGESVEDVSAAADPSGELSAIKVGL